MPTIESIPILSVSYNSPELIEDLLGSVRKFYGNLITIIDGSNSQKAEAVRRVCDRYSNVRFIHFDYNIHHGPGMAWAFRSLPLKGPVLVLDSDLQILHAGMIEAMLGALLPGMYGVGHVGIVDEEGFDLKPTDHGVRYLHPACMLCNVNVVRQWPMPVKHGAPMTPTMLAIHRAGRHDLIAGLPWLTEDFRPDFSPKHFIKHDWQGTVRREGNYHLNEWQQGVLEKRVRPEQKSQQHTDYDVLTLLPEEAHRILEVVSSQGSLEPYRKSALVQFDWARINLDGLASANLEQFAAHKDRDVWILPDVLGGFADPWDVLSKIRGVLPNHGSVIASVSNTQYWPLLVKLFAGDFRYEVGGWPDIAKLRFFTRSSMLDMLTKSGFKVDSGFVRLGESIGNEAFAATIRHLATTLGFEGEQALQDCRATHFVVRAVPA